MGMPLKDEMIVLFNKMSNEDKVFMIELMSKDIYVSVDIENKDKETCYFMSLNNEMPVLLNGIALQLNLDEPIKIEDEHSK